MAIGSLLKRHTLVASVYCKYHNEKYTKKKLYILQRALLKMNPHWIHKILVQETVLDVLQFFRCTDLSLKGCTTRDCPALVTVSKISCADMMPRSTTTESQSCGR